MTIRRPCPPAPGRLEAYAGQFDPLFSSLAQRRGLRDYLQGLLLPRDRNKTLTGLAGAEPIAGAQHREVQRLQWFLSESAWDHELVNARRVQLLCSDPATAPHDRGALVIDDTGDRKDGTQTAHVARQYLGSVGKIDNGIVAVTSLWADERVYWPVHAVPYTPASRLPGGERDPGFRTKPQLALELVQAARAAGIPFRAVVADCAYGDNPGFTQALGVAEVPFVLALKPRKGTWAPADAGLKAVLVAQPLMDGRLGHPGGQQLLDNLVVAADLGPGHLPQSGVNQMREPPGHQLGPLLGAARRPTRRYPRGQRRRQVLADRLAVHAKTGCYLADRAARMPVDQDLGHIDHDERPPRHRLPRWVCCLRGRTCRIARATPPLVVPMGNSVSGRMGNYVIVRALQVGNSVIADTYLKFRRLEGHPVGAGCRNDLAEGVVGGAGGKGRAGVAMSTCGGPTVTA
jgi:hypothetical protein